MKEYTSDIKLIISGNNHYADNKKEYIEKVKSQFYEDFNLMLESEEITNIEEVEQDDYKESEDPHIPNIHEDQYSFKDHEE